MTMLLSGLGQYCNAKCEKEKMVHIV